MKCQLTIILIISMLLFQTGSLKASEPAEGGKDSASYQQLQPEFGVTNWRLDDAGFLQTKQGFESYSGGISFITNLPVDKQWTAVMGAGFHSQSASIDASERSSETFPKPFEFDQPQAVDEFDINYYTMNLALKARYSFSEGTGFFVETGPEAGVVMGFNYEYNEGNKTISYDLKEKAHDFKLNWDLGVGYDFDWNGDRWAVGLGSFHQLTPVLEDADIGLAPRGAQLFLRYEY